MALFEIETKGHIVIAWVEDEKDARKVLEEYYPEEEVVRVSKRPRSLWVISKAALGIPTESANPSNVARDCLAKAAGDKVHAIRLYMQETGTDLEKARKVIESTMVYGW